MAESVAVTAFQATVERYERDGWVVRTIDRTKQRAIVQLRGAGPVTPQSDLPASPPARTSACCKLWVDSQGAVQETTVPC